MNATESAVRPNVDAFDRGDWDAIATIFIEDAVVQGVLGQAPLAAALGV